MTDSEQKVNVKISASTQAPLAGSELVAARAAGKDAAAEAQCQASDRATDNEQLLSLLPGKFSMILPMIVTVLIGMMHVTPQLTFCLPMHLWWTSRIYRLSMLLGETYGAKPPLAGWQVAVISLIAFPCIPMPFAGIEHGYDPLFWIWCACQLAFPVAAGLFLRKHETDGKARKLLFSPACYCLLLLAAVPGSILGWEFETLLWFFSQNAVFAQITRALRQRLAGGAEKQTIARLDDKDVQTIGEQVLVRYRRFAELENWLKQRLSKEALQGGTRKFLLWVGGPLALVITMWTLSFISWYVTQTPAAHAAANAQTQAGALSLRFAMLAASLAGTSIALFATSLPTHLLLEPRGTCLAWRRKFGKRVFSFNRRAISWNSITEITLRRPQGKTSPLDDILTFHAGRKRALQIRMASIGSIEAKEAVLHAIQKWAGNAARDANVMQALQPPADHSYTELWLQALAAPPKRERLKPLVGGALLRDGVYQVTSSLGVGGQGQAYLSCDLRTGKNVVLKEFILPVYVDVSVRRTALEQFENEARILRQLEHPQIVGLLDFFVEDHRAYLVLEHIEGASLRSIVEKNGPLPEQQVRALAKQMCGILQYLHGLEPPVVHRDFTTDNMILRPDGTIKLIDFNVAKQSEATTVGTVVGKHAYLPPEQFRGSPCCQSDIYAMGASLFYLLTGKDPEPISTSRPVLEAPQTSPALNALVEKATALDMEHRYRSISELSADLEAHSTHSEELLSG